MLDVLLTHSYTHLHPQMLIDKVFLSGEDYECGCKCNRCCYTGEKSTIGMPFYYLSNSSVM